MATEISDMLLVRQARSGDEEALSALLVRYADLCALRASAFCCALCEKDDLMQEAMLGLVSAVRGFDESRGTSFRTFAGECVDNRILSYIRSASRQNRRQGVTVPLSEAEEIPAGNEPEEVLLRQEEYESVRHRIASRLSPYEKQVLGLYLEGLSYAQMGERLGKSPKSVGNALMRLRRKLCGEPKK